MQINVKRFQDLLKKATLNYTIPSVQFVMDNNKVTSKMRTPTNNVIVILQKDNDIITGIPDTIELNFDEPASKVKPYIQLIDDEVAEFIVNDEKVVIKAGRNKTNLHQHVASFITTFTGNKPTINPFYELKLTNEVKEMFSKVRKIAGKFDKVYFGVKDNKFYIETTDKTNRFSNGISYELGNLKYKDVSICFGFKQFNALFTVMDDDFEDFSAKFSYIEAQEAGMITFEKEDGSETYYLLSQLEDN